MNYCGKCGNRLINNRCSNCSKKKSNTTSIRKVLSIYYTIGSYAGVIFLLLVTLCVKFFWGEYRVNLALYYLLYILIGILISIGCLMASILSTIFAIKDKNRYLIWTLNIISILLNIYQFYLFYNIMDI